MVSLLLAGPADDWLYADGRALDFFDAKGALEALMTALGIEGWSLADPLDRPFHPGRSATVEVAGEPAGAIGELHPRVAGGLDLPTRVAVVELDVGVLAARAGSGATYREIPRFPPVRRDLAFTVDASIPAAAVRSAQLALACRSDDGECGCRHCG